MNKSVQKKAWIGIVLSVLFYSVIVLFSDVEKIINQFNNIKLEYYVIIFPLIFFGYVVLSLRFNLLLKKLNINISYRNSFLIHLTGGSMAITPGGLGAVIKSHILKEKMGKSFSSTAPVTIFEKWIDF